MSKQVAKTDKMKTIEAVLIAGDLSALTADERVTYYKGVCESVGLNPLTQPFDYITLQGKLTLYAKKSCTDQLRSLKDVSINITNRELLGDVYLVTARASIAGRTDESIGAVSLVKEKRDAKTLTCTVVKLSGDELANAYMKAETKAKRRATLSICGLGLLDESELETVHEGGGSAPATPTPSQEPPPVVIQKEIPTKPAIKTKALVGAEILRVANLINLSRHEMDTWIQELYGCETKKATLENLEQFLDKLMGEAGRAGITV